MNRFPGRNSYRVAWMAVGVYVLAVAVRLVFLSQARHCPLYQWPTIDEREYHELAIAVANGTLPSTPYVKAPGYFYLLGMIYKIAGPDPIRGRCIQLFIFSLSPVLVFLIACRLFGHVVGLLAGGLASVFWTLVFFSTELLDISMASLLYLLLTYLLVSVEDRRWWKWLACGIVLGLGAITRPNILAFLPVLAVMIAVRVWHRLRKDPLKVPGTVWARITLTRVAQLGLGTTLAIAPVTLRNYLISNERVLIGIWGPGVFYIANNPQTDGKTVVRPTVRRLNPDLLRDPSLQNEGNQTGFVWVAQQLGRWPTYEEVGQFYARLSKDYVRHYPGKLLRDMFKRFCFLLNVYEYPFNKNIYTFCRFSSTLSGLSWLHYGIIAPLGLLGLAICLLRRPWPDGQGYLVASLLTYALPCTLFQVVSRYRVPLLYYLMPFAAYGAVELVKMFLPPISWRRLAPSLAALAVFSVFSNANVFSYRPARQEYLPFYYAAACMATARHDLVVDISNEIEQTLQDPDRAPLIPPNAMILMFEYFHSRGDVPRAVRYGQQILRRGDEADSRTQDAMMAVFTGTNHRADASQVLDLLRHRASSHSDPYVAQAMLRYGLAYADRDALALAKEHYVLLLAANPQEPKLRNALAIAVDALKRVTTAPASNPATTRSLVTSPSVRQVAP